MKYLIVNADDLGASPGVNRGIAEAHRRGPLTSASLMVNMPASGDGARLARDLPAVSVGLHANLTDVPGRALVDAKTSEQCGALLQRQLHSFEVLVGRPPTHLDSHHNLHRNPRLLPYFLELAHRYRLPLREHSPVRYCGTFYGQWGGETHLEQISVDGLIQLLEAEIPDGITELSCHPGYCDTELRSSYRTERETELQTLCNPKVTDALAAQQIRLVSFADAAGLFRNGADEKGLT